MHLDKANIKRSFAAASMTYDRVAALQRTVGNELLGIVGKENLAGTLLDLGCGTGFLTAGLLDAAPSLLPVIALDIALPMLQMAQTKLAGSPNVIYICADAEQLPLAGQIADSVFSNLALQWCINLEAVFADIKRVLKPGGRLVFSTFGPKTLQELKAAWATADGHSHVNDFYSQQQLTAFLKQAGYSTITMETTLHCSGYGSVLALMRELKDIGAHNMNAGRNRHITTKTAMQRMIAAYAQHQTGSPITATFEVIMVSAT